MALPPKWYQFLVCVFASLGSALYGYDLGVIAGAVNSKNFTRVFSPEANEVGAVVSVFTGGRKKTIFIGAVVFILGGGLQTGAQNLGYLYAGRLIAGLGRFSSSCLELEHLSPRGCRMEPTLALQTVTRSNGECPWVFRLSQPVFLRPLILLFPDSPRWLIDHGRQEEGLRTLAKLHSNGNESDAWVQAEFQ
ncbi:hypothetical protein LTR09_008229 [Extremus antarcticus]|uniref:Major facilitator superfamily (MFS) profile domain-containing protein n=1 Tax=Extremus antarcticus TaxID=702011 RepID=A0AAJ0G6E4_9PEZI|nr:hypothetical protein LTR09_008229 [Extremus antarcticus]